MAAASAGAIHAGSAVSLPDAQQQQQQQLSHHHQNTHVIGASQVQHQQPLNHHIQQQQQPSSQHHQLIQQSAAQQQQQTQRISYVQRAGNGTHVTVSNGIDGGVGGVSAGSECAMVTTPSQQQTSSSTPAGQRGPNVAPGWRRYILDGDVIYVR